MLALEITQNIGLPVNDILTLMDLIHMPTNEQCTRYC